MRQADEPVENLLDEPVDHADDDAETVQVVEEREEPLAVDVPWRRLSARMIAVDVARTVISVAPSVIAFVLLDVEVTWGAGGALVALAVFGVVGALQDALRWVTTRYRLTDDYLERSTGLFVRRYRTIRRDRIRSVDTDARLRHRVAGLRVVLVGAGQQSAAAESALSLDAIVRADAVRLRDQLLRGDDAETDPAAEQEGVQVLARFRLWWIVYNVVGIWAFLMAAGVVWGGSFFLSAFGLDVIGWSAELVGWGSLDWPTRVGLVLGVLAVVGAVGLAIAYVTSYWRFELARVPGAGPAVQGGGERGGSQLRTRHGLFRTREVNRDDRRLRGVMLSEPLLWRWMRMADTEVITTGLSIWSPNQPASILPRGPRSVALQVAGRVLGAEPDPLAVTLQRPPRRALRRRLVWASLASAVVVATTAYAVALTDLPGLLVWVPVALWPVALAAAFVAYRALGYAIAGVYAVVRSGLVSRRTAVLQRGAVSTIIVRESLLQRRLGLRTVTLATAAGWGAYTASDLDADEAVRFADVSAPGLLAPYVEGSREAPGVDIVAP